MARAKARKLHRVRLIQWEAGSNAEAEASINAWLTENITAEIVSIQVCGSSLLIHYKIL